MTPEEWERCADPEKMLEFLRVRHRANGRKLRLFAVACCRAIWHLLGDGRSRRAVEVAEASAEGLVGDVEVHTAWVAAREVSDTSRAEVWQRMAARAAEATVSGPGWGAASSAANEASMAGALAGSNSGTAGTVPAALIVAEFRARSLDGDRPALDVYQRRFPEFGTPFQEARSHLSTLLRDLFGPAPFRPASLDPAWLAWHDGAVKKLAGAVYKERELPSGHLDGARLGVLADMLEEAGLTDAALLRHLRGPGPHVLGCHALELLLGKE
jgi:hypothetical protein